MEEVGIRPAGAHVQLENQWYITTDNLQVQPKIFSKENT